MIETPTKNIELTHQQVESLDLYNARLSKIEASIEEKNKELRVLGKDVIKLTKEREYQEELLGKLNTEIPLLQAEKQKLETAVKENEAHLTEIAESHRLFKAEHNNIVAEQAERENKVREGETKFSILSEEHRKASAEMSVEKDRITKFKEELSEVLKKW